MKLVPDVSYDLGYFDKDHEGWCTRRVSVVSVDSEEGVQVLVEEEGDDNGANAYRNLTAYRQGELLPELHLVRLLDERGETAAYFDRARHRVVHSPALPPGHPAAAAGPRRSPA